jgi:hypothetical protein
MKVMCSEDQEAQAGFSFNVEPSATQDDRQATTTWHVINSLIVGTRQCMGQCSSQCFWAYATSSLRPIARDGTIECKGAEADMKLCSYICFDAKPCIALS